MTDGYANVGPRGEEHMLLRKYIVAIAMTAFGCVGAVASESEAVQVVNLCRLPAWLGRLNPPPLYLEDERVGVMPSESRIRIERPSSKARIKLYYKEGGKLNFLADLDSKPEPQHLLVDSKYIGDGWGSFIGDMYIPDVGISFYLAEPVSEAEYKEKCGDFTETIVRSTVVPKEPEPLFPVAAEAVQTTNDMVKPATPSDTATKAQASQTNGVDIPGKLRELYKLREEGVITQSDYQKKKESLLSNY